MYYHTSGLTYSSTYGRAASPYSNAWYKQAPPKLISTGLIREATISGDKPQKDWIQPDKKGVSI